LYVFLLYALKSIDERIDFFNANLGFHFTMWRFLSVLVLSSVSFGFVDPQIGKRVVSWMDRSADPCQDFYQFACGGISQPSDIEAAQEILPNSFKMRTEQLRNSIAEIAKTQPFQGFRDCCAKSDFSKVDVEKLFDDHVWSGISRVDQADNLKLFWDLDSQLSKLWDLGILQRSQNVFLGKADVEFKPNPDVLKVEGDGMKKAFTDLKSLVQEYSSQDLDGAINLHNQLSDSVGLAGVPKFVDLKSLTTTAANIPWKLYTAPFDMDDLQVSLLDGMAKAFKDSETNIRSATLKQIKLMKLLESYVLFSGKITSLSSSDCDTITMGIYPNTIRDAFMTEQVRNATRHAQDLYSELKSILTSSISASSWMDSNTKSVALKKINQMIEFVGLPDFNFSSKEEPLQTCSIDGVMDNYVSSTLIQNKDLWAYPIERFDRSSRPKSMLNFNGYPIGYAAVNPFYDDSYNSLSIPFGILGVPFFEKARPMAMDFGSLGALSGHEMSQ
jgi:hypothetical protein